jgi:hypothetical protein
MRKFAFNQIVKHLRIEPAITFPQKPAVSQKRITKPASKAVRLRSNSPWTKILPVTGRFDYNQKLGNLKELLQKKGAIGTSVGKYFLYRVLLPTLP